MDYTSIVTVYRDDRDDRGTKDMGKLKKKGQVGTAANYLSRGQAIRRLQLSLGDFRRLCILKGIYPREPKNPKKLRKPGRDVTPNKTFYHLKDIQLLQHEPLLDRFRELRAFAKKVRKLVSKREWTRLENLEPPKYTLDHLVKERYPTFMDALEDVDDALSMMALFAQLPKEVVDDNKDSMKPLEKQRTDMARSCFSLMRHWEALVAKGGLLKKAFISIKGIYYQADIMGHPVTWLSPLEFAPAVPKDVDFRVMATFLEFYQTLLKFINFRLFSTIAGWTFPFNDSEYDAFQAGSERPMLLAELPDATNGARQEMLLGNCKVFLSREVPRRTLAFLCQSMGCLAIGWSSVDDSSPFGEDDSDITHQIIDRPALASMVPGRVYVQPQWLFDSLNAGRLLDTVDYKVGAMLPSHLSPFVPVVEDDAVAEQESSGKTEAELEALEQKKLSVALLSKKKRKLYERIQQDRSQKTAEKKRLADKKAALRAQ